MKERAPQYGTFHGDDAESAGMLCGNEDSSSVIASMAGQEDTVPNARTVSKTYTVDSTSCFKKLTFHAKENMLLMALASSLVVGVILGCMLRLLASPFSEKQQVYLQFPGEILMNMLKLLILPLIVSSLISGMISLDSAASGRMVVRAVCYYLCSMMLAVILGIILVVTIRPGDRARETTGDASSHDDQTELHGDTGDTFLDLIRQLFPDNIIQACFSKKVTKLILADGEKTNGTDAGAEYKRKLVQEDGINMLGLVVFSLALGVAINRMGQAGRPLKDFVKALADATMLIVNAVIWYSPVGILFLVAGQIVGLEDAGKSLQQLGLYMLTVILGLLIHSAGVLPLIYFLLVRKNPYRFMYGVLQAMVTALGTSSSSATIPVTMRNLQENNGLDPRVISFVIPVGATINMDGTALYEAVATIFIGQLNGLQLSLGKVITICITATAAAIGAAGVPQAGLVTMVIVLESVGFPTSGIAMVLAVDWMLDRIRTVVNVLGDAYGAGIVNHFSEDQADNLSMSDQVPLTTDEPRSTTPTLDFEDKPKANVAAASANAKSRNHQTSFYQN
ncbi:hypothetical protein RRG08_059614 [Elysia crispata]|uniref:Amino acid transporter n=1 Tax=Elysia crispata TaxID=231223 RepID=A0AAE1AHC9_9GAST|nr:hypothetical protein RRG08_059614 [Elysia crispata]